MSARERELFYELIACKEHVVNSGDWRSAKTI